LPDSSEAILGRPKTSARNQALYKFADPQPVSVHAGEFSDQTMNTLTLQLGKLKINLVLSNWLISTLLLIVLR